MVDQPQLQLPAVLERLFCLVPAAVVSAVVVRPSVRSLSPAQG
ncbi:hypothetical protein AB3S75_037013 [Citrus x aurantiifolia]